MKVEVVTDDDIEAFAREGSLKDSVADNQTRPEPRIRRVEDILPLSQFSPRPVAFLHEPELPEGAVVAFTGDSGCGKSTLALWLAGIIAQQYPVLVLDRENPASVVRERMNRFQISDGTALRYWGGWQPEEAPDPGSAIVLEWVARSDPRPFVIVDSFVAFHGGNENDAGETRAFIHQCRRLADRGATVLLIHHDGKADSAKDYRGSSDFKAAVDQAFHITNSSLGGPLGTLRLRCYKSRFGFSGDLNYRYQDGQFIRVEHENAPTLTVTQRLTDLLRNNPGSTSAQFECLAGERALGRNRGRDFLRDGAMTGRVRQESGPKNAKLHFLVEESTRDAE
ncbi:MAG: AAA family ATPase [Acidobacteria bacterium]|nr:AAA family ATPase [Acidobacteriota bacterium]